jgi:hypothetical protein
MASDGVDGRGCRAVLDYVGLHRDAFDFAWPTDLWTVDVDLIGLADGISVAPT